MELSVKDREFFHLVKDATFANPFSDTRVELDLKISRLSPKTPYAERIDRVTREVHGRIENLDKNGYITLGQYSGQDREFVRIGLLFDFFHQFIEEFDALIPEQIKVGERSVPVPFAGKALADLHKRGFGAKEASHYFAICYQFRRAFYFIEHSLIGSSQCMKELRRNLWNNVFTYDIGLYDTYLWNRMEDFSTLILGETGTGKGTSAISIGRSGFIPFDEKNGCFVESFARSFVSLNLSQFPETLIESELFGHKKGSFTGAMEDHKGVFDRCSPYGSIFLDEIGEVTYPVQIKLLQVLQDRIFVPVGSHQQRRFRGRVIAATNRSVHEIREKHILRDDFFYRLCSDIITVPSLRQRIQEDPEELDDLIYYTIERMIGQTSPELANMVTHVIKKQLNKYPWPGNVRELEQCIRRILLKRSYEGDLKSLEPDLRSRLAESIGRGDLDAHSLLAGYCYLLYKRFGTFEAVSKQAKLDRRTAKKYIKQWEKQQEENNAGGVPCL